MTEGETPPGPETSPGDVQADPVEDQRLGRLRLPVRGRVAVALVLIAAAVAVIVFSPHGEAPRLTAGPDPLNQVKESIDGVGRGETAIFGDIFLCLDRPGRIAITSVRGRGATSGFRVDDFAVHINPWWNNPHPRRTTVIGDARGTLADNHVPRGWRVLHLTCDEAGRGYFLTVQVTNNSSGIASAQALDIAYTSEREQQTLEYPRALELCPASHSTRACENVFDSL